MHYCCHCIIGKSFIEMVEYLFKNVPGVKLFLSNRICQDPLENFFGQQRQRGKCSDNPNASEFLKNTQALRVINSTCSMVRGNCRETKGNKTTKMAQQMAENCEPLAKHPRK